MSEGLEYETIVQNGPRKVSAFYYFFVTSMVWANNVEPLSHGERA